MRKSSHAVSGRERRERETLQKPQRPKRTFRRELRDNMKNIQVEALWCRQMNNNDQSFFQVAFFFKLLPLNASKSNLMIKKALDILFKKN